MSIDLPAEAFDALRGRRDLRMVCCDAPAVPKRSVRGLPFFAHGTRGECHTAAETLFHLQGKALIALAAREAGWTADVEAVGKAPDGELWRADVLCTRGTGRMAFEVQHSGITLETLHARQARYTASGVHGVWFMRTHERALRGAQPWQRETPALYVTEQHQVPALGLSLEATVEAMLGGHLDLFPPPGRPVQVTVLSETIGCFHCAGNTGLLMAVWLCPPNSPDPAVMLPGTTAGLAAWVHGLLGPVWGGEQWTFTEWPQEKPRVYACPGCERTRQARAFRTDEHAWRQLADRQPGEPVRPFWAFRQGRHGVVRKLAVLTEAQHAWWMETAGGKWMLSTMVGPRAPGEGAEAPSAHSPTTQGRLL